MARKTAQADPIAAMAAQAVAALGELGVKAGGSSWKVPCAYGTCDRTFDPNGVGSWIHSNCELGTLFFGPFAKATKAGDTDRVTAILAAAKATAETGKAS